MAHCRKTVHCCAIARPSVVFFVTTVFLVVTGCSSSDESSDARRGEEAALSRKGEYRAERDEPAYTPEPPGPAEENSEGVEGPSRIWIAGPMSLNRILGMPPLLRQVARRTIFPQQNGSRKA